MESEASTGGNSTKGLVAMIRWDDPNLSGLEPDLKDIMRILVGERVQKTDPKKKTTIRRKARGS